MKPIYYLACFSLAFVWLFTGLTSIFFAPEVGFEILAKAQITGIYADIAVFGGGLWDIFLGIWLIVQRKLRSCCIAQIVTVLIYSMLLTIIDVSFWLHPFGPVTKNLPILVLIVWLYQEKSASSV
ncbi:DoxX-like family protein [Pseudoalteromonas sp. SMS1]|uniref:DoxX-like family protein n=1 Tax=Pseudoalteromonas sp. SMS1 TaxID=2908894 RepID=UPI001F45C9A2|nr:DoxX-like family protein [Pseudoalteromonas sp. SMS1]MCF2856704.1 DoxX-like family protein [Pseudoalteromonas sp. SMS1]